MKKTLVLAPFLLFVGCSDNAQVTLYDKSLKQEKIECLELKVTSKNEVIAKTLKQLYHFKNGCHYKLVATDKSHIVCNSNQNAPLKATSNFPSAFLNLSIYKRGSLAFSYYVDLTHKVEAKDVQKGFKRVTKELNIVGNNK